MGPPITFRFYPRDSTYLLKAKPLGTFLTCVTSAFQTSAPIGVRPASDGVFQNNATHVRGQSLDLPHFCVHFAPMAEATGNNITDGGAPSPPLHGKLTLMTLLFVQATSYIWRCGFWHPLISLKQPNVTQNRPSFFFNFFRIPGANMPKNTRGPGHHHDDLR